MTFDRLVDLKNLNTCVVTSHPQPLISIVTVVLNGAKTLEKALLSVVNQKFIDYEYIIIDGKSTDGSVEIIKKYESRLSVWISEPDRGVYDAMNKSISLANGKWIYFLGADDCLLDDFEAAVKYLIDENTLYYANVYRPVLGRNYDGKFSAYKLACKNICHQSIFYPRCVWDKYSYDLKYQVLADYHLNLRCFSDINIKFQYIPLSIAVFSDRDGVSPTKGDSKFESDKILLIKAIFPFWIYVIVSIRTFLLMILKRIKLQKTIITIYHYLQRVKSTYSN